MLNYLISISKSEVLKVGTIHDPNSKLKVKVFDLLKPRYTPCKGEVRFFVTSGNETLAFETKGYNKHCQLHILRMISWYCIDLGWIEIQIHAA